MIIREAAEADFEAIWPIFQEVVSGQDTYAYGSRARSGDGDVEHSQSAALEMGCKAMQFSLVVETNRGAARLWQKLGFGIVGTIPKAFDHIEHGYVGAHVMFKWLAEDH